MNTAIPAQKLKDWDKTLYQIESEIVIPLKKMGIKVEKISIYKNTPPTVWVKHCPRCDKLPHVTFAWGHDQYGQYKTSVSLMFDNCRIKWKSRPARVSNKVIKLKQHQVKKENAICH